MSEFVAGFAAHESAGGIGALLAQTFAPRGFAPADLSERALGPRSFVPAARAEPPVALDPIRAAHAAGFAEGQASALATARRDRELASEVAAAIADRVDRELLAAQLRQTVLHLVAKIVDETGIAADVMARRIEAATDLLSDSAESALLRVHPDDVALLTDQLPANVFAVGDAGVARGGFVLEAASTIVEDGPDLWLEQLSQAIDRVAMPGPGPVGRA